jgi:hypothetical protein
MATKEQKKGPTKQVRIYEKTKERLQKVVFKRTGKDGRAVTETELASVAVEQFCEKEEKKLGI